MPAKEHEPYFGAIRGVSSVSPVRISNQSWLLNSVKTMAELERRVKKALDPFKKKNGSYHVNKKSLHAILEAHASLLRYDVNRPRSVDALNKWLKEDSVLKEHFGEFESIKENHAVATPRKSGLRRAKKGGDRSFDFSEGVPEFTEEGLRLARGIFSKIKSRLYDLADESKIPDALDDGVFVSPASLKERIDHRFNKSAFVEPSFSVNFPFGKLDSPADEGLDVSINPGICTHHANALSFVLRRILPDADVRQVDIMVKNRPMPNAKRLIGKDSNVFSSIGPSDDIGHAIIKVNEFAIDPSHYKEHEVLDKKLHSGLKLCRDWSVMPWDYFEIFHVDDDTPMADSIHDADTADWIEFVKKSRKS
ncbi:MAG: hypothetical protein GOV15_04895 [Candidatus Diapherotrites archaeon]|nr:hypothetical protein [Candidatus Diapherotrites archaeon]